MHEHITPQTSPLSPRLCLVKALRDIFMSQDASSLKQAFDALCTNTLVSEETLEMVKLCRAFECHAGLFGLWV